MSQAFIASDMVWQRKRTGIVHATPITSSGLTSLFPSIVEGNENGAAALSLDETGILFAQELSTVAKMLRKFYIDTSNLCEKSRPLSPLIDLNNQNGYR